MGQSTEKAAISGKGCSVISAVQVQPRVEALSVWTCSCPTGNRVWVLLETCNLMTRRAHSHFLKAHSVPSTAETHPVSTATRLVGVFLIIVD